jgi:hypothetical protein
MQKMQRDAPCLLKIVGPIIFKETNSNHYIKSNMTPLFRELTEEEKM